MYHKVLKFWFEEIDQSQWWVRDDELDKAITTRFASLHASATLCELVNWRKDPS